MTNAKYAVVARVKTHYHEIGHRAGDLLWWVDDNGIIFWRTCDGIHHHHDMSPLDMDARWRGRLDAHGTVTLLPPVALYAKCNAEQMLPHLPIGPLTTLGHLGARRFYMDTKTGMVRIAERRKKVRMRGR